EPGGIAVLDALARAARVLLPLTVQRGTLLEWAVYGGSDTLVAGPLGLRQPADDSARGDLADAEVVLVPAVAMGLDGSRLGHGAGYYDRALAGWPAERLVGVVHDDEVALALPAGPHDVRIGWLCTPTRLQRLGE
ncbi:5-formyltetrahydrofolate cyclo-ligase, partial [Cumulibacter manganitolerans]|uniref:5-formyltetrahydrofolate cyclo-ligase n=1 Tax=Cumulibacter manganitolerans TaxID=1884992 RepID=UPI00129666BC